LLASQDLQLSRLLVSSPQDWLMSDVILLQAAGAQSRQAIAAGVGAYRCLGVLLHVLIIRAFGWEKSHVQQASFQMGGERIVKGKLGLPASLGCRWKVLDLGRN
jgi:hypothetical protein